jgi:hypothetical protein
MHHEDFKNITSGIQSIALSLAVIVGGIWSLYTFWGTKQLQKAQAEERRQVPVLNLSVHVLTPLEILPSNQARLVADVEIRNDGSEPMMVDLKNSRLRAIPSGSLADPHAAIVIPPLGTLGDSGSTAEARHFRPNQVRHLLFVAPIASTTAYLLQAEVVFRQTTLEKGKIVPTGSAYRAIEQAVVSAQLSPAVQPAKSPPGRH